MLKRAANSLKALRLRPLTPPLPYRSSSSQPSALTPSVSHIKAAKINYPYDPASPTPRGQERPLYENLEVGSSVGDFTIQGIHELDLYKIKVFDLRHKTLKTRYIHLDSADLQNAFAVLFRTPSTNNKGVTHILEHTVLCGSAEFPVRDPFFNMIRRSLNTYMNAWTGSDFTMYPFATQNRNDFYHLLAVYLDAAFAPQLLKENFLQEGHRLEFNGDQLVRKGVVLNQMKGTMSSADNRVLHDLQNTLFPEGTYHYNQGGEPDAIPELTYEEFKDTHSRLYHPHNATFLSYGDLDFAKHIAYIEKDYLDKPLSSSFDPHSTKIHSIPRWSKPHVSQRPIQAELTRPTSEQGKYVVSFVLQDQAQDEDGYLGFRLNVISKLLTEGPNSPFYKALIESELAPSYGPGVGYDNTTRDATFTISVDGVPTEEKECVKKLEQVIRHTLRDVAQEGFSERQIEATLHLLNLEIREQRAEFGLKALSAMIPQILHEGNIETPFRVHQHSQRLKEELRNGQDVLTDLVKQYFVENQHCAKIAFIPKENIAEQVQQKQQKELETIKANLSQEEKKEIRATAEKLRKMQEEEQPVERLPSLTIKDIPLTIERVEMRSEQVMDDLNIFYFPQPTNGITYVRFRADIRKIPEQLWPFIPFFTQVASRVGSAKYKHNELNEKIMMCSSGLEIDLDSYVDQDGDEQHALLFEFSFLDENREEAFLCMTELLARPNFKDQSNMSELVKEISVQKANNIGQEGLRYALSYGSGLLTTWASRFQALQSDVFVCQMGAQVLKTTDPSPIFNDLGDALYEISRRVLTQENLEFAVHGSASKFDKVTSNIEVMLGTLASQNIIFQERQPELERSQKIGTKEGPKIFFKTPLTVNHCTENLVVPHYSSAENGKLRLLGSLLTTNWLHPLIREKGGAYGAGCRVNETGMLSFFSYFDPRVVETYYHFEEAVVKAAEGKFDQADLEQAKLLTFQRLDRIAPAPSKGLLYFARGYTHEKREEYRAAILKTEKEELRDIASQLVLKQMEEGRTSRVVVGSMATTASGVMEEEEGWKFYNPTEFLSQKYFEKYNE